MTMPEFLAMALLGVVSYYLGKWVERENNEWNKIDRELDQWDRQETLDRIQAAVHQRAQTAFERIAWVGQAMKALRMSRDYLDGIPECGNRSHMIISTLTEINKALNTK